MLYETGLTLASACSIVRACESSAIQLSQILSRQESVHAVKDKPTHDPLNNVKTSQVCNVKVVQAHVETVVVGMKRVRVQQEISRVSRVEGPSIFLGGVPSPGLSSHNIVLTTLVRWRRVLHNLRQIQDRASTKGTYMQRHLHSMELEGATPQEQLRYLDQEYVTQLKSSDEGEEWHEDLSVNSSAPIRFKLDSGATCNLLPLEAFRQIQMSVNLSPGPRVRNYGAKGGYLKVVGVFKGSVVHRGVSFSVKFVVVDEPGQPPILGLPTCKEMKLIKRIDAMTMDRPVVLPAIVKEFMDVFDGIGKLPVQHIRLASGANYVNPVVCAAGRLPFRLEEKVYKKLEQIVSDGVITPVVEPTEWVSRMMVVGKPDGDVRTCLDPSELNKAIQRQHFSVPTVEQLFGKIGRAKHFCSLDAAFGFYQIPLTEEASYLCSMATPKGRFRYLRLPFGLKSAPEV